MKKLKEEIQLKEGYDDWHSVYDFPIFVQCIDDVAVYYSPICIAINEYSCT